MRAPTLALWIVVVGAAGLTATADGAADQRTAVASRVADSLPSDDWGQGLSGPLCGVYSACTALQLIGVNADPREFVAAKYVGQCGGSSPEEVARVVEHAGARAQILSRLSAFDVRLMGCPLIANVRISPGSERFNHWVVAIRSKNGVTIFDGLHRPYEIRMAEFLGSWSGLGIAVAQGDDNPLLSIWLGRILLLLAVLTAVLTGAVVVPRRWNARMRSERWSPLMQVCGLFAVSVLLGIGGNVVFGDLPHHGKGVAVATAVSRGGGFRMGTLEDAVQASSRNDMLLVDARREQDYRLGTIEGAVNIPVTASSWAIGNRLDNLSRDTPIVVFCQSARCPYDEIIGGQLVSLGFRDVTVCDEGWSEYRKTFTVGTNPR